MNFEALLIAAAERAGKTTILQESPRGGYLIYVTKLEVDPMTALMSAALMIMVKRGDSPDSSSGITIRRVTEVAAPGCEVFWQVMDVDTNTVIANGYTTDEHDAAMKIAEYLKPDIKLPSAP